MAALAVPPGRMGRLWVLNRLALAERGVTLLDEKVQLLSALRDRLQRTVDQSRRDWHRACDEADTWGLRATLLSGQFAIDLAAPEGRAAATIGWAVTTGVRYPDTVQCSLPPEDEHGVIHTSSASVRAGQAYRAAVAAAGSYAAALSALNTVERELEMTRLRARALSKHWLPRLRQELARIDLELEEQDRDATVRVRVIERRHG